MAPLVPPPMHGEGIAQVVIKTIFDTHHRMRVATIEFLPTSQTRHQNYIHNT